MKRAFSRTFGILFYAVSAAALATYILAEVNARTDLTPSARIVLLCITALFLFFGSRLISENCSRKRKELIMKATFWGVFAAYAALLVTFTFFDTAFGRTAFRFIFTAPDDVTGMYTKTSVNLIPFRNIGDFVIRFFKGELSAGFILTNIGGNLLAFMPMAFFLPLLTKRFSRFLPFVLFTGICIITVEVMQILLLTGFCDIDDLILNLGGACAAYRILRTPTLSKLISRISGLPYPREN